MTSTYTRNLRHLGVAAAAALIAGGVALVTPASAQEESGAKERHVDRVIVVSKADGSATPRRFRVIETNGELPGCDKAEVTDDRGDTKEKTKVVFCGGDANLSAADRADRLEKVLARIQQNDALSAEHKEKVAAAMREAISKLRASN
jgi:2-hydroxy-3-keto-5-methylthiopentenyl-1-phosphate phosphatase